MGFDNNDIKHSDKFADVTSTREDAQLDETRGQLYAHMTNNRPPKQPGDINRLLAKPSSGKKE